MKTAKVKEHVKPKGRPKHTGKIWPQKRKVMEHDKENKPAKKKTKSFSANVKDDELHAKTVMSKTSKNVNARDLYKAQKQKLKCVTIIIQFG